MPAAALVLVITLASADASAPVDAPPSPPDAAVSDAGELQGTWEVVSVFVGKVDESEWYKGDRFRVTGTTAVLIDAKRGPISLSEIQVNPAADRPTINKAKSDDGIVYLGIYRRTADGLVWAIGLNGVGRPASFDPARNVMIYTLRRVKK